MSTLHLKRRESTGAACLFLRGRSKLGVGLGVRFIGDHALMRSSLLLLRWLDHLAGIIPAVSMPDLPVDIEPGDTRFAREYFAAHLVELHLLWRILPHFLGFIRIVHIVPDTNEFGVLVGCRQ